MRKYFLAKTEPSTYSIDDLEKEIETVWDGVHNYEAINYIKLMSEGDFVYIYHSMKDKKIVGLAEVAGKPFENKDDPRHSWAVRMRFVSKLDGPTLAEFKADKTLPTFKLVTHSRLSVMEVPDQVVSWISARV
jgi:predicted RNA-binding protein with PUA-like domain